MVVGSLLKRWAKDYDVEKTVEASYALVFYFFENARFVGEFTNHIHWAKSAQNQSQGHHGASR